MAGVSSIHHIPQNEVCKWHVKSVNVSVFVCVCDWSLDIESIDHGCCLQQGRAMCTAMGKELGNSNRK